jgi:hypothetical protein
MLHPTLSLYRNILRQARIFPSIKRDKVAREIQDTFRLNRYETDPGKVRAAILLAEKGLSQLRSYTDLRNKKGNLEITLEQNPMPSRSQQ